MTWASHARMKGQRLLVRAASLSLVLTAPAIAGAEPCASGEQCPRRSRMAGPPRPSGDTSLTRSRSP